MGEIMIVTLNQTDNYKLRLNVERVEVMDNMFLLKLESQLNTAKDPKEYQTVFSTTVTKFRLAELHCSLETFLFMER
jgi:hypothetical protein